jgi:hypothetical protein
LRGENGCYGHWIIKFWLNLCQNWLFLITTSHIPRLSQIKTPGEVNAKNLNGGRRRSDARAFENAFVGYLRSRGHGESGAGAGTGARAQTGRHSLGSHDAFELCQSLHSLSYTSLIPIFIITGEAGSKYKDRCESLGAKGFFQKPVDFKELQARLALEMQAKRPERRAHVRVRMRVVLKLRGTEANGKQFEETTATENVSAGGFLCPCTVGLIRRRRGCLLGG